MTRIEVIGPSPFYLEKKPGSLTLKHRYWGAGLTVINGSLDQRSLETELREFIEDCGAKVVKLSELLP